MAVCAIFARLRSVPVFPVAVAFRVVAGHLLAALRRVLVGVAEFLPRSHGEALGCGRGEIPPPLVSRGCSVLPGGGDFGGGSHPSAVRRQVAEFLRCGLSGVPSHLGGKIFLSGLRGLSPALCARFSPVRSGDRPLVATRCRCRCGPPVAFRRWSPDARILALEPLCGVLRLSGQDFPSRLRRLSPRLCGRFSAVSGRRWTLPAIRRFAPAFGRCWLRCRPPGWNPAFRPRIFEKPRKFLFWPA